MSNNNVTCGLGIFTLGPECSGNGLCVYDPAFGRGVCQCFPGWTGVAEWVTRRIREGHAAGYKMALQIQPFGGKKGKFYLNGLENKTALSWRDSTFLVCLDTFGLDVTQMQKFQEETDKELIGTEGALLGNEDRRLIWGSHDKDLPANHQYYYESKEMYDRLCEIKKKIDPDNVFTPNRFCVGASST